MKKILILIFIIMLTACAKNNLPNISSEDILTKINKKISFDNSVKEDLTKQNIAQRYGISPNDIENGIVYYTNDENKSDKIIIIKSKSKDKIENIERALSAEIVGLTDSWKENEKEMLKIEKHIFKTKDIYIIMAICDDAKEVEKIFDDCFK